MEHKNKIKNIIEGVLEKIGIKFDEVNISDSEDSNTVAFIIKSPESGLLIGTHGAHISALNHLVKRMAAKALGEAQVRFYVDVNDYHDRVMQELRNRAKVLADRARSFQVNIEMEPMSPYERMIIHTFFENVSDIKTESTGTGTKRRVILKYIGDAPSDLS